MSTESTNIQLSQEEARYNELLKMLDVERHNLLGEFKKFNLELYEYECAYGYTLKFLDWCSKVAHRLEHASEDEINHRFFCLESRFSRDLDHLEFSKIREILIEIQDVMDVEEDLDDDDYVHKILRKRELNQFEKNAKEFIKSMK
jgi:hypothetical protein